MTEAPARPLLGFTVAITAARRADELATLLERRGAAVLAAPAIAMVPLSDDERLRAATEELLATPPDLLVATTGIGFRGWLEAAEGWGLAEPLLVALGAGRVISRGPKATGALRAAGLETTVALTHGTEEQQVLDFSDLSAFRDDVVNSVAILGIWIGVSWIFSGVTSIVIGISDKQLPNRVWVVILGIISLASGAVLIAYPFSVEVLVLVAGIWAVAIGIVQVISAFQLRSTAKQVQQRVSDLVG